MNHGQLSAGLTPFSTHVFRGCLLLETTADGSRIRTEIKHCSQPSFAYLAFLELIGFYQSVHSVNAAHNAGISSILSTIHVCLHRLFPAGSAIFKILLEPNTTPSPDLAAVLIYLNAIVWHLYCSDDTAYVVRYFHRLYTFFSRQRVWRTPSLNPILWALMTDPDTLLLESPERMWLTAHLLNVLKDLSKELRRRIEVAFLRCLFDRDHEEGPHLGAEWKPCDFANEILVELR